MAFVTKKREFPTGNFALTTALMTAGFKLAGFQNIYDDPARPERNRSGALKSLGRVKFYIDREAGGEGGIDLDDALAAYDGDISPGEDIDQLLDGPGDVSKQAVRDLLGLAYVECAKNTLANLKEVKLLPSKFPAHIQFIKDDGFPTIISENMDRDDALKFGVDLGDHKFKPMPL